VLVFQQWSYFDCKRAIDRAQLLIRPGPSRLRARSSLCRTKQSSGNRSALFLSSRTWRSARPKGFEPLTSGLEIHRSSTELRAQVREVARDLARFAQAHKARKA
jgi:hypothetical protein